MKNKELRPDRGAGYAGLKGPARSHVLAFLVTVLFLFNLILTDGYAQKERTVSKEYIVKAAMIYKMLSFITWPEDEEANQNAPINLCVYGKNPFGKYIYALESESVDSKSINVIMGNELKGLSDCQVLFISTSEKHRYRSVISKIQNEPVLTISDIKDFSLSGGMIEFVKTGHRIGLVINYGNVLKGNIRISSRLLRIAKRVYGKNGEVIWSGSKKEGKER